MKLFIRTVIFLPVFTILISCGEPGSDKNHNLKNPNEMIWTSDTLAYPGSYQTGMNSIWGSSSQDVWICGHNDQSEGNLWHFNGFKWQPYNLFNDIPSSANSLFKVFGFSANNVWIAGNRIFDVYTPERNTFRKSLILQYDGIKWREHVLSVNGGITDLWGKNPRDIWVNGWGIVSNYDGTSWKSDTLKYFSNDANYQLWDIREFNLNKYMTGVHYIDNTEGIVYYLYHYISARWIPVDSFKVNSGNSQYKFGTKMYLAEDGKLYSFGFGGVFEFDGTLWKNIKSTFSPIYGIIKFNDQSIIAVGDFGQALYYNGTIWEQIDRLYDTKIVYRGIWSDGKEVFIIGILPSENPLKTIVWHGK